MVIAVGVALLALFVQRRCIGQSVPTEVSNGDP